MRSEEFRCGFATDQKAAAPQRCNNLYLLCYGEAVIEISPTQSDTSTPNS